MPSPTDRGGRRAASGTTPRASPATPTGTGTGTEADRATTTGTRASPATMRGTRADPALEHRPATAERPPLEIHRSARRRRSASAAFRDDRIVVRLPAGLPPAEEQRLLEGVVRKVTDRHRPHDTGGDEALAARAMELADAYLDGVRPTRVTFSTRMGARYGSCTPTDGTIRISSDMAAHPDFVRDYVLIHELAHLQESGHGPEFEALVARFPSAERARGYLEGYQAGRYRAARGPIELAAAPIEAEPHDSHAAGPGPVVELGSSGLSPP